MTLSEVSGRQERTFRIKARASVLQRCAVYGFAFVLGYLGVTTFALVRYAPGAVAARKPPETFRTTFRALLAQACIAGSVAVVAVALGA